MVDIRVRIFIDVNLNLFEDVIFYYVNRNNKDFEVVQNNWL